MTTRRNFLTLVGSGAALGLVGCSRRPVAAPPQAGAPDVLLADTSSGLAVLRGIALDQLGTAVAAPDGATIFATQPVGSETEVRTIKTSSGEVTRTLRVPGAWVPAVAGGSAGPLALVPPGPHTAAGASYAPGGAARTNVLVVDADGKTTRLDLAGNYVPDAFTRDGTCLFVLDWLPATAPEHYRVRAIDLPSKQPTPLFTRDKQVIPPDQEEQMRGLRRNAVFAPVHDVLYTLYTHQPGTGGSTEGWPGAENAFIHTLQLDQRWAYCVDLPDPFGLGPNSGHALAISPDGMTLFVVDAAAGRVAVVDTAALTVKGVETIAQHDGAASAVATDHLLFVSAGPRLATYDVRSLAGRTSIDLPSEVLGLTRGGDGSRVYAGSNEAIDWYDAGSGAHLGEIPVKGLTGLR